MKGKKPTNTSMKAPFPRVTDIPFVSLNICKGRWPCPSVALPGPSDEVLDSRAKRVICVPSSALIVHYFAPSLFYFSESWAIKSFHLMVSLYHNFSSICEENIELARLFSGNRAMFYPPQMRGGVLSSCAASAYISFHFSAACWAAPVLICSYAQSISRDLTIAEVWHTARMSKPSLNL